MKKRISHFEFMLNQELGIDNSPYYCVSPEQEQNERRELLRSQLQRFELVNEKRALSSAEIDRILQDIQ